MPRDGVKAIADQGQRRTSLSQARSVATKGALIHSAMALWRANGYATTTVADICRAAGVSKPLFYFYFPRKEDVLFEAGVLSTEDAYRTARALLTKPYDLSGLITETLRALERTMQRHPPELIFEAVLEGYRHDQPTNTEGRAPDVISTLLVEIFDRAVADGKLPAAFDVDRVAFVAQTLIGEGVRHWAAGKYGQRSFAEDVGRDVAALIAGFSQASEHEVLADGEC
jgi:AcrR family transcriptional regulator